MPSEFKKSEQPITPQQFAEEEGGLGILPEDMDMIYEIGLEMNMDPRDIFDFMKNSDIKERLINREMPRERIRSRLMAVLPFDDVAKRAKEVDKKFKRFVVIMALREYERLQYLRERGLDFSDSR